jgi:pilus assembly protein Flp/PilA
MLNSIKRFCRDEEGATATEYAMLLIFIALAIAFGANALGLSINQLFQSVASTIGGASVPSI